MTTPNFEDFQKFSKQQIETVTAVTSTVTKGLQEIAVESTDYSKKAFAESSAVVEKLLGAKSVETAIQIHKQYVKLLKGKRLKSVTSARTQPCFCSVYFLV